MTRLGRLTVLAALAAASAGSGLSSAAAGSCQDVGTPSSVEQLRAVPPAWTREWPRTCFQNSTVEFDEILSGGPPKDGIPAIDDPEFHSVSEAADLTDREPVIVLEKEGFARAYPIRYLMWHEIVNDTIIEYPSVREANAGAAHRVVATIERGVAPRTRQLVAMVSEDRAIVGAADGGFQVAARRFSAVGVDTYFRGSFENRISAWPKEFFAGSEDAAIDRRKGVEVPVVITFCPLCNSALAFDRVVDGTVLSFGVTGKLRNSDLIMYDRQTESWWQQFTGEGIVGEYAGKRLAQVPVRLESWASYRARHPRGEVMRQPNVHRPYGRNPYVGYDSSSAPFLYFGEFPHELGVEPLERVVRVEGRAWPLERLRREAEIRHEGLVLSWRSGQASALDAASIGEGREVGDVLVVDADGKLVPHEVVFAFAFHAFVPDGEWMLGD